MHNTIWSKACLLACMSAPLSSALAASAPDCAPVSETEASVYKLLNQRLGYMKDVAGYKAENHQAIEDLTQEQKVMDAAVSQAESLGLDGDSVKGFMAAQMNAAKAIQYRYRADWLSVPEKNWTPTPLDQVREQIGKLSTDILAAVSNSLKQGARFTGECHLMSEVNQKNLSDEDKQRLWISLGEIKSK